jgi:hypothetical protein
MQLKIAELSDIDETLLLHNRYQLDSMSEEDKKHGFITTHFSREDLTALIEREQGLFLARDKGRVIAYVMAASWTFWASWPLFGKMIEDLPGLNYKGHVLSMENSYQYGPVCIDRHGRGTGLLERIFDFSRQTMAERFPILITFVNKANPRSYNAHTRKLRLDLIHEFEFNGNQYFELARSTNDPL